MLNGRARDIKKHKWFEGVDWEALAARRIEPNRLPQEDSAKRIKELAVRSALPLPLQSAHSDAVHPTTASRLRGESV